jgi:hypothetical protein
VGAMSQKIVAFFKKLKVLAENINPILSVINSTFVIALVIFVIIITIRPSAFGSFGKRLLTTFSLITMEEEQAIIQNSRQEERENDASLRLVSHINCSKLDLHRKSGELPSHLNRHTFVLHRADAAQI